MKYENSTIRFNSFPDHSTIHFVRYLYSTYTQIYKGIKKSLYYEILLIMYVHSSPGFLYTPPYARDKISENAKFSEISYN